MQNGVTCHILAIDTAPLAPEQVDGGEGQAKARSLAIGFVAIYPTIIDRYHEGRSKPYMSHESITVDGMVGGQEVYQKVVSPKGAEGFPLPFYGIRVAVARKRAGKRVKSILSA